jgi:hypothetical protein
MTGGAGDLVAGDVTLSREAFFEPGQARVEFAHLTDQQVVPAMHAILQAVYTILEAIDTVAEHRDENDVHQDSDQRHAQREIELRVADHDRIHFLSLLRCAR